MGNLVGRVRGPLLALLVVAASLGVPPADSAGEPEFRAYESFGADGRTSYFGSAVAVHGDTILVGAYRADDVRVMALRDGLWTTVQHIRGPETSYFGMSLAVDGKHLVVGAPNDDLEWSNRGAAYAYEHRNGAWALVGKLSVDDDQGNDFGSSVAVSGDWIAVGDPVNDVNAVGTQSRVHVYRYQNGGVSRVQTLTDDGLLDQRVFGYDLDMDGDRLVVGAPGVLTDDAVNQGGAFVYRRDGSKWVKEATFDVPLMEDSGGFGSAVAVGGDYVFVCDNSGIWVQTDDEDSQERTMHIYHRSGTSWSESQTLDDEFCSDVAVEGDRALVARVRATPLLWYERVGGVWKAKDVDHRYTVDSVAIDGDVGIAGDMTVQGGRVYLLGRDHAPVAEMDLGETPVDLDGDGVEPVTLSAAGSSDEDGDPLEYHWYVDGVLVGAGETWSGELPVGDHDVLLAVNDPMRGTDLVGDGLTVLPPPPPKVDFVWLPEKGGSVQDTFRFVDASTSEYGRIVAWSWDLDGDDAPEPVTGPAPEWTYKTPGKRDVTLTVTTDIGTTASRTKSVPVVNLPPAADAGMDQILDAKGGKATVQLDGGASKDPDGEVETYTWREGKSVLSRSKAPKLELELGVHDIDLTVEDDLGAKDTDRVTILVLDRKNGTASEAPKADFNWDFLEGPPARAVAFHDQSTDHDGRIVMWWWDFDGGDSSDPANVDSTDADTVHGFDAFGSHLVSLTVVDDTGNQVTKKASVFLQNHAPTAGIELRTDTAVVGQTVVFLDASKDPDGGLTTWAWDFGDGATSAEVDPFHVYDEPGSYTITLTVTDDGGKSDDATATLEVAPAPDDGSAPVLAGAPGTEEAAKQGREDAAADGGGALDDATDDGETAGAETPFGLRGSDDEPGGPLALADPGGPWLWVVLGVAVLLVSLVGWAVRRR